MKNNQRFVIGVCSLSILSAALCGCVHQPSYDSGYDDGYSAGYQQGINAQTSGETEVKVSGSFTATVRALIPDYVADSVTPRAAVVTLFQDGSFVLKLDEEICSQLEEGETYTFIVPEQSIFLSDEELYDSGIVSADELMLRHIYVTDFRTPTDDEYGLECWRVNYST